MNKRVLGLVGAALLLAGAVAAACTSNNGGLEDDVDTLLQQQADLSAQIEDLHTSAQKGAVLAGLTGLQQSGLHELDEALSQGELPEGATGTVNQAIRAMAINWPEELQAQAEELATLLEGAATAIDSGDAATAEEPIADAHSAWHEFDHEATNWLTGAEGDHEGEGKSGEEEEGEAEE